MAVMGLGLAGVNVLLARPVVQWAVVPERGAGAPHRRCLNRPLERAEEQEEKADQPQKGANKKAHSHFLLLRLGNDLP